VAHVNGSSVSSAAGTHPLWHFGLVAGAAVAVFAYIKVRECLAARSTRSPADTRSVLRLASQRTKWPVPHDLYLTAALSSAGAAAIHAAVCPAHFRAAFAFGAFFAVAAALQAAWTVQLWYRVSRRLLLAGAIGNTVTVAVWAVSRTIGLPIGPRRWHPEAVSAADLVATALEVVVVVTAGMLLLHAPNADRPSRQRQHAGV
jgi:hypothetical protein